jgi:hypothetical protein
VVWPALVGYLVLVWVLLRWVVPGGDPPGVVALGVLAGFPLVMLAARVAGRHGAGCLRSGRVVIVTAIVTAGAVPVGCMVLHGTDPGQTTRAAQAAVWQPAAFAVDDLPLENPAGLQLRIRGLTLVAGCADHGVCDDGAAVLLLDTRLARTEGRQELIVTVRLRATADGLTRWQEAYRVSPQEPDEVRAVLRRALADAMRYTREGSPRPRLV